MTALLDLQAWRAAVWTRRSLQRTRHQLQNGLLHGLAVPAPPRLRPSAERGVYGVLRRVPSTCLERAFVLQRWRLAHGDSREVVIGVSMRDDFRAHAWLDGEQDRLASDYHELLRVGPVAKDRSSTPSG